MPQLPMGIVFEVQSKTANQSKWQNEDEFIVTPELPEGDAAGAAYVLFDQVVASHSGGAREYRVVRCEEQRYESR